jgi:hypothetical protein
MYLACSDIFPLILSGVSCRPSFHVPYLSAPLELYRFAFAGLFRLCSPVHFLMSLIIARDGYFRNIMPMPQATCFLHHGHQRFSYIFIHDAGQFDLVVADRVTNRICHQHHVRTILDNKPTRLRVYHFVYDLSCHSVYCLIPQYPGKESGPRRWRYGGRTGVGESSSAESHRKRGRRHGTGRNHPWWSSRTP